MRNRTSGLALAVLALLGATLHAGELEDYLARHRLKLEPADRFQAGWMDTSGKRIFLLGENHAVAGSEQLDLALLRYLHDAAGVRFYLMEGGFAPGEMFNRYFANGDEKLLDFLIEQTQGSPAWNRENREFWKAMGEWNRTLPSAERVRVVGVDVEHQRGVAWRYLADTIAASGTPPAAIRQVAALLQRPQGDGNLDADLAASLAAHHADWASLLGPRLADFELVTTNLQKRDEYYASQSSGMRDRVMYETFRTVAARYPDARWYGRFGNAHIPQQRTENYDPFATLLARDPEWRGKIVSLWSLYRNCSRMDSQGGYRSVPVQDNPQWIAPFAAAAGSSRMTLFRLDAEGSPLRLPGSGFLSPGAGAPTDYVQYVALMQDAPAAHPLHEVSLAGAPPVVVRTMPESGAADVPADLAEIRITFSKAMRQVGWSFVSDAPFPTPAASGDPHYVDGRTVALPVKLQPGTTYGVWINSERFQSFRDDQGQPAVPYLLVFHTRDR